MEYAEGIINGSFTFKNVFFAFFLYLQELYFYVDECGLNLSFSDWNCMDRVTKISLGTAIEIDFRNETRIIE